MKKILSIISTASIAIGATAHGYSTQDVYTIYPRPQEQILETGKASFTQTVSVIAEDGIDQYTRDRLTQILQEHGIIAEFSDKPQSGQSAIYLGINGSGADADRKTKQFKIKREVFDQPKYDRHVLSLRSSRGKAQLIVLGEHTDAVFYGLATLEQMLDQGTQDLTCVTIYDYADVKQRGIIEGYYGVPYSEEVTADLFRFMARYKLNTYMYGAKSDPYHSQYWDKAYPETITDEQKRFGMMTQDMMHHLCEVAHQCKVNFIWSIHPGSSFMRSSDNDVLDRIMSKFEQMYELGVRGFGVFVDDVGVPYDEPRQTLCASRLTQLQEQIDARWNQPEAKPEDMVHPLQYVPQLYAFSWAKKDMARQFWQSLKAVPGKVNLYTTGRNVWSVPNSEDLGILDEFIGRQVSWWWNYPCNDVDVTKLFIADTYTNFADESNIDNDARLESDLKLKTIVINPMQQGELSKIPLFSVADYTWNMDSFDNMSSWRAALNAVIGEQRADVLERLTPYLRYFDAESPLAAHIKQFKSAYASDPAGTSAAALISELAQIAQDCEQLAQLADSDSQSDRLFYADIRPWLLKLKAMAEQGSTMLQALTAPESIDRVRFAKSWSAIEGMDKNEAHQFDILRGMGSDIRLSIQTAEPAAQELRPFLDWLLTQFE